MKMVGLAVRLLVGMAAGNLVAQQPMSQTRDMGHPTASDSKRPMTFADLMAMKRVSDPQVSPGGKWVMFSVTEVSLEKNSKVNHLWVVPLGVDGNTPTSQTRDVGHPRAERQMTVGTANETNGRFSPDGKWVLYSSDVGGESQLWLAPWDEVAGAMGSPRSPLTAVSTGADGGIWSPDSRRVLFVSSVYPECSVQGGGKSVDPTHHDETVMNGARGDSGRGGGRANADPSTTPLHGSAQDDKPFVGMETVGWAEEEACDRAKNEAAANSPVKAQLWTSLLYRHWNAYTGKRRSHVLVVDVSDGLHPGANVRDLTPAGVVGDAETPTFSLGGPLGYAWAPDSKEVAYVVNLGAVPAASTNNDVFTLRLDEPGARAAKVSTSLGSDDGPQYSPDGRWLAFRSQERAGYESDRFRLMLFDRRAGTTKEILSKFGGWIDEFSWGRLNSFIIFTSGFEGEERIYGANDDGTARLIRKGGEFGDVRVVERSARSTDVVATEMMVDRPSEIVDVVTGDSGGVGPDTDRFGVSEVDNTRELSLTRINDTFLDTLAVAKLEPYWFEGAEGAKVQGFIVKPPNFDPKKKYPVKFLIHGGPQGAWGDAWSYRWNPELMAASGYVVVMVNPRGSTGYGQAFIDGVNGDWGGKAYEDLMRGLDAAEKQFPFIDKDRECALGASYGGFMANWILTHTNRFKCIVTHDGMYNPAAAYGDTEEMWFNEWEFRRRMPDGSLDTEPASPWRYASLPASEDPFRKWSPMLSIQNAKTPTLVIHSQRDYRLDVSEGFQLFTALQRLGVPSEMLYFPDEGHWVLKPQNSELWNKTVSDWCDRWLKP